MGLVVADVELLEVADEWTLVAIDLLARRDPALLEDRAQIAALPAADLEGLRAARMERAPSGGRVASGICRAAGRAGAPCRVGLGDRADQRLRVRVLGVREDLVDGRDLHYPARYMRSPRGRRRTSRSRGRDVDIGLSPSRFLRSISRSMIFARTLMSSIETGCCDEQVGAEDDRRGRSRRARLAADRSLGRLSAEPLHGARRRQAPGSPDLRLGLGVALGQLVDLQRVRQRRLERHTGFERRVRVLEDHLQVPALGRSWRSTARPSPRRRSFDEPDRPHEPEQRAAQRCLAGPDSPTRTEHLALAQVERNAVDGLHEPPPRPSGATGTSRAARSAPRGRGPPSSFAERPRSCLLRRRERLALDRRLHAGRDVLALVQPALGPACRARGRGRRRIWTAQTFIASGQRGWEPAGRRRVHQIRRRARDRVQRRRQRARSSTAAARASTGATAWS